MASDVGGFSVLPASVCDYSGDGVEAEKMTKQDYELFISDLEKFRKIICEHEHNDCDHNRCMACINGCYGDECAFDVVIESIEQLERESNENRCQSKSN